ncbi:hypothetical protein PGT21_030060 [Puccinia graminis f. sp. tritici]|uniref:Uncharacterized protein n=1 Tax=Puccinia graminis f. sp. tritici TaxID=56615 RepID=A0A5B0Q8D9_PUCGR|nr:hypothetical protein PGT21_030060 [Puccinia graminis f. sp. tritici]KAA1109214.1 hypothetical protein PGTUg99_018137 [Puccinia graminis f. sp. tritici]
MAHDHPVHLGIQGAALGVSYSVAVLSFSPHPSGAAGPRQKRGGSDSRLFVTNQRREHFPRPLAWLPYSEGYEVWPSEMLAASL